MSLPPGQRDIGQFPRFGTHFHRPPPEVPPEAVIKISGEVRESFEHAVADLADLPRREITADFHCVSGWSATGLRWGGVAFTDFYQAVIEPRLTPGAEITHVVFGGSDGFESLVTFEDATADDVLLADHLNGEPLGDDHGAPVRLVSPQQYGYMNTKHLSHIEVHRGRPKREMGAATPFARLGLRGPLVLRHERARVWAEERHPFLPARLLRPLYRLAIRPGIKTGALAAKRSGRGGSS